MGARLLVFPWEYPVLICSGWAGVVRFGYDRYPYVPSGVCVVSSDALGPSGF
jgi:hypothetical protein